MVGIYSFNWKNIDTVLLFFTGVLLNQFMLYAGLYLLLIEKKKTVKTVLLLTGKFAVLAGIFIVVMQQFPNKLPTLVICYTFQLIILTLSIKRKTKKI